MKSRTDVKKWIEVRKRVLGQELTAEQARIIVGGERVCNTSTAISSGTGPADSDCGD